MIKFYTLPNHRITNISTQKFLVRSYIVKLLVFFTLIIGMNGDLWGQTIKTVGTGTTADDDAPVDPYFNFNYSQIIYTKAAIDAGSGTINNGRKITAISFYYRNSGGTTSNFNGWKIFMKNSSKTTFTSTTNWESISGATTVFDGTVSFPGAGNWMTITLTTPFIWDGTSSIIVSVDENTAGYSSDANIWNTASNTNTVLYYRSDGTNPDPAAPPTGTRSAARPNIRFTFADYSAEYTSMSIGSSNWCPGETRTVSATIKNNGVNSWADGGGVDINVGVKWNYEGDYISRVDAASLASGSSATYNLSMTAPGSGSENLTFNVVREGVAWFGGTYSSSALTILSTSTAPTITGSYCPGETTVSGTGINGSTINVIRSGSTIGTATVSGGVWSATVSTLAGGNVLTATQTESGKCVSVASSSNTVKVSSTAPVITGSYCPGATTVSGTGVNGSTISVIRSGSSIGTATVSGGVWTATVSALAGADVITATQIESGKCVSVASSGVTVTSSSATPAITGTYCAGNTTISGTGVNGATIDVFVNGVSQGTTTVSGGIWSKAVAAIAEANSLTATQLESGKCLSDVSSAVSVGASISGLSYTSPVTYCQNTAISTSSPTITGTGSITYSGTLPAGLSLNASNGNITGTPTSASAAANYLITADNGCNTTNFNVNIAVTAAPVITSQPASLNVCEGNSGSFTVATSAGSPSYQWQYFDGVSWVSTNPVTELSGHTATTLDLTGAPVVYNGASIRCNVTASGCSTASNAATLTVVVRPTGGTLNSLSFCTAIGGGTVTVSGTSNASQYAWTLAPQLSGSSTTASIAVTSSTVGSHSISVLPQNVAAGLTCNALSSISGSVGVTAVAGDATTYGSGSWIGYVYNSASAGAFTTYMGVVTESETFNRTHTTATGATVNHCSVNEDFYAIRYKMTKSFTAGYYTLSVGGDDGVRLSIDGGATWLVNNWVDQGYTVSTSTPVYLSGSTNLVFEYYENGGGAQSSFSYACASMTPSAITGSATVCQLNSGLAYSVTNVANLTYNWTLPGGWSGSSTSNSISLTAGTSGGTLSVTTTNGCGVTSGATTLVISTTAAPTNVNAGVDVAICSGSTTLVGSAIYSGSANTFQLTTSTGAIAQTMTGATSLIGASQDDAVSAVTNIGFNFVYEGVTYTQFSSNSNGLIRLGGTGVTNDFGNAITDNSDNPKIMPLWDDISTGTAGYVRYKVNGSAPNRILVIEHFGRLDATETNASTSTFQTLFYETTNEIEFIYVTSSTSPGSATIGIAGATYTNYLARNANTGNVFASTGAVNTVSSWPGNGTSYKFSPAITYAWSNGAETASTTVSPSSTTTYTVTATSNGCSNTDQVVVTVRTIPAATAANNGPICAGNTVNLTASNMAPSGQVANFTGTATTSGALLGTANTFTMELWVNPTTTRPATTEENGVGAISGTANQRYAIFPAQAGTNGGAGISVGTNGVSVFEHGDGYLPSLLVHDVAISGWTHIAVVYNAKTPSLYINGNLVKTGLTSLKPNVYPSLGTGSSYGYYEGAIDNVRVWSTSRSASEILANMNLEAPVSATGLIARYDFTGNTNATVGSNLTNSGGTFTVPTFYTYTWSGTSAPAAATTETQTTGAILAGGNYTVVATSTGCSGTASSATAVTVNSPTTVTAKSANDYVWDGSTSTVWNLMSNWLQWDGSAYIQPSGFPNLSTDNVIIPATGSCVLNTARIGGYSINVNNLTIESGHTFQMNNASAVLNIYGTFTNSGTWSTPTAGSTVNYAKSGAQSILALTYSNLTTSGSGTKTLAGTTTLNRVLTIGSGTTFAMSSRTMRVVYTAGVPIVNDGTFNAGTGTVDFRVAGNQTIPALTYYNLNTNSLNTGGIKTLNGNVTVTNILTLGDGTTLTLGSNTLNLGGATPIAYGTVAQTGTISIGTSTINYSGTGAQAVKDLVYHNLGTTGSGAKTLAGATSVANTLALTDGVLTLGANTLTMNGSTMTRTSGSIDASDASATLAFGNASLLTLPASVFSAAVNNLTLTGTRVKATSDFSVNGVLNLGAVNPDATNGLLDLVQSYGTYGNTYSVNSTDSYNDLSSAVLTLGASATITGDADITGKVRRTSFTDGVTYAFNNKNMRLTFDQNGGASLPSQITIVATKGDEGLHIDKDGTGDFVPASADTLIGGAAVKRLWQVLKTGGSSEVKFDIRFPYEDSELNGNVEADLVTWDHHLPYAGRTPHEHGKTNVDATNNWVELSGHGIGYLATEGDANFTKYWMLAENIIKVQTWLGAAGGGAAGDWYTASNWSKGAIPTVESILIPSASSTPNDPDPTKLPASISLATIEIQPGGVLNGGSSEITLSGGPLVNGGRGTWLNNGTFTPGTSKVIFDYTDATISGSTTFNDITVNTGKKVTIQANSDNTIIGTVVNNGTFDATDNENTITFAGSGQSVFQPNGTVAGYHNLTIAQTSGSATAAANLTAQGSVVVSSGTFDLDNNTLDIKGDFTNNATVSNPGTVTLSGTGAQAIGGSTTTTFNDLTMNGGSGTTTLNQNINVASVLTVGAGKTLSATDKTINLTASGTPFANSGTFTAGTSTVHYNNAGATSMAALTYHNLQSTGAATKTLLGNLTVSNQLSIDGTTLDIEANKLTLAGSGASNPTIINSGVVNALDGEIELTNAASVLTFPATFFVDSKINDLTLNGAGGAATVENLTLIGDLDLVAGTLDIASNKLTIDNGATVATSGGFVDATAGSIAQKAATLNANALTSNTAKNLEIDRAGGVAMSGNLEVTDEFKLTVGTFDIVANTLKLDGTLAYTAGGLDADNGTVDFSNTSEWDLPTTFFATDVKNLALNGVGGLKLNESVKVSNQLDMVSANIEVVIGKKLEIGTSASTVGQINWTAGTVVGKMKRWFSTSANFANSTSTDRATGIFPVGTDARNRYAQINFIEPTQGGYIEMEYKIGTPTVLDEFGAPISDPYNLPMAYSQNGNQFIQNADGTGYWEMNPFSSAGVLYGALDDKKYNLVLRINSEAIEDVPVLANPPGMRIIRAKGAADGSHDDFAIADIKAIISSIASSASDFTVYSDTLQGFSWFNIGGDNETPLPIELISFTGFCGDNESVINWKTASEFNSSYYIVEKSTDGQNWREVNNQAAAGFSTEELTYQFVDESKNNDDNAYYRLTQFDTDGEFTVYDPIFVSCNENVSFIKTYPNPSDASFQVLVNNPSLVGKATIKLVDTKGTVVSMKEVEVAEGTNLFYLNENMAPGIYYLSINNGTTSTEIIKHSVK